MVSGKQLYIDFKETSEVEGTVENLNILMEYALFVDDFDVAAYCAERLPIEVSLHDMEEGLENLMIRIRPERSMVKAIGFSRFKKILISAASFIIIMFSAQLVSQGTGKDFFKVLFSGKDKQLFFETDIDGEKKQRVFVPDGFYISEYSKEEVFFGTLEIRYFTNLENPDIFLHYQIQRFTAENKTQIGVETGETMEQISINDKTYFITNNYELSQMTWYEGMEIHSMYGNISTDALKEVITMKEKTEEK